MPGYDLKFQFRCQPCNGWPRIQVKIDDRLLCDHDFSQDEEYLTISVPVATGTRKLSITRYGKTQDNTKVDEHGNIVQDQILEIKSVDVRGSRIPDYIFDQHSVFQFDDQTHLGSRYFGPNGQWTFEFVEPLVTWILDQKILHEAQYSNDYIYPWAYKFGPGTAQATLEKIRSTMTKVQALDL